MSDHAMKAAVIALERANEALNRPQNTADVDLQPVYAALQGKASAEDIERLRVALNELGLSLTSKAGIDHEHEDYATKSALAALQDAQQYLAAKDHKHDDIAKVIQQLLALVGTKAKEDHNHAEFDALAEASASEFERLDKLNTDAELKIELLGANKADIEHRHDDVNEILETFVDALGGKAAAEHEHEDLAAAIAEIVKQVQAIELPTASDIEKAAELAAKPAPSESDLRKLISKLIPAPIKGDGGDIGPMPKHEIKRSETGVSIRFETAVGEWGEWVKIRFPQTVGGGLPRSVVAEMIENAGTGGGSVTYTNATPTPISVGGIETGSTFNETTFSEFVDQLLYPELFPSLTNPSASFTASQSGFREIGQTFTINFAAAFSRGAISPQYESDEPYRSGLPNLYDLTGTGLADDATADLSISQSVAGYVVLKGGQSWSSRVYYDAGVQPKGSQGSDYDSPLASGNTSTTTRTITGVYPYFATTADIATLSKQGLTAFNTTVNITLKGETGNGDRQTVEFPSDDWSPIARIEQYNALTSTWEDIPLSTFTVSATTNTVQGAVIDYRRYTYNASTIGERLTRWSV
ncbi:MAG: hypothetical protein ACSHWQ_00085 [Spongiibacteraceae bacterium]